MPTTDQRLAKLFRPAATVRSRDLVAAGIARSEISAWWRADDSNGLPGGCTRCLATAAPSTRLWRQWRGGHRRGLLSPHRAAIPRSHHRRRRSRSGSGSATNPIRPASTTRSSESCGSRCGPEAGRGDAEGGWRPDSGDRRCTHRRRLLQVSWQGGTRCRARSTPRRPAFQAGNLRRTWHYATLDRVANVMRPYVAAVA